MPISSLDKRFSTKKRNKIITYRAAYYSALEVEREFPNKVRREDFE